MEEALAREQKHRQIYDAVLKLINGQLYDSKNRDNSVSDAHILFCLLILALKQVAIS